MLSPSSASLPRKLGGQPVGDQAVIYAPPARARRVRQATAAPMTYVQPEPPVSDPVAPVVPDVNNFATACPLGLPNPVHASHPADA